MIGLVSFLLFFIGVFSYFSDKSKHLSLIIILILSSNYFGLESGFFLIGNMSLQHGDLALLLIFILIPFRIKVNSKHVNEIKIALSVFLIFLAVSIFYDYTYRGTSLMQIFRTTRNLGYLSFLFLIGSFKSQHYQKLFKFLITITVLHSFFYISQYIFGYSYTSYLDSLKVVTENESGGKRYTNGPTYLIPIMVLVAYIIKNRKVKFLLLILFLITIILGQSRGAIISVFSIFFMYTVLNKKLKLSTLIIPPVAVLIIYFLLLNFFPIIEERFVALFDEVELIDKLNFNSLEYFTQGGSFIFRLGLTYERFMYVMDDEIRMLLGVGFVPDMDITSPIFILGTHSPMLPTGFEQYNTVDVFFPNILTRFGFVGSAVYIYFIISILRYSYKNKMLVYGKILLTYLISLIVISFINETFYNAKYFIILFALAQLIIYEESFKSVQTKFNK